MFDQAEKFDEDMILFWRRAYIRAVYALVEGVVYSMKQYAIAVDQMDGKIFSPAEIALLTEKTYDLSDKGEVVTGKAKISVNKSIKHAFRAVTHANQIEFRLGVGDVGWDYFQKGIEIRDRITHPKKTEDLHVSKDEEGIVFKASIWFINNFNECLNKIKEGLEQRVKANSDIANV
jgi:hypothetical protein